jgi:hypothetical protein
MTNVIMVFIVKASAWGYIEILSIIENEKM